MRKPLPHHGEALEFVIRQRAQQHGVDDAEDAGVGADTEADRIVVSAGRRRSPPQPQGSALV
jgi:hypothetical protein